MKKNKKIKKYNTNKVKNSILTVRNKKNKNFQKTVDMIFKKCYIKWAFMRKRRKIYIDIWKLHFEKLKNTKNKKFVKKVKKM